MLSESTSHILQLASSLRLSGAGWWCPSRKVLQQIGQSNIYALIPERLQRLSEPLRQVFQSRAGSTNKCKNQFRPLILNLCGQGISPFRAKLYIGRDSETHKSIQKCSADL